MLQKFKRVAADPLRCLSLRWLSRTLLATAVALNGDWNTNADFHVNVAILVRLSIWLLRQRGNRTSRVLLMLRSCRFYRKTLTDCIAFAALNVIARPNCNTSGRLCFVFG